MTYTHSTHLLDFGTGYMPELSVVCGNYCRRVRTALFGGRIWLDQWSRIPQYRGNTTVLIPCAEPIAEREGSGLMNTMGDRK